MGNLKWLTGVLGWVISGPIGGLIGFLLGQAIDNSSEDGGRTRYRAGGPGYNDTMAGRNSFFVSLMVLSSAVIKADGKTQKSELDVVANFVRNNFGQQAVDEAMKILDELGRQNVDIRAVGAQIAANMNYSQRLQLLNYLVQIAIADGEFSPQEKTVIEQIAAALGISQADCASTVAMYYNDVESAYAVLEISSSATDDEVKSAYRRMAMKHHPDKVASLGEDVRKAAEAKFMKIQEAYETIKRHRGIN